MDSFTLANPVITFSSFDYVDPEKNIPIKKGLNFITTINITDLKVPETFKPIIDKLGVKEALLYGSIPQKVKDAALGVEISKIQDLPLSTFVEPVADKLPANVKDQLNKAIVKTKKIGLSVSLGTEPVAFTAEGSIVLFNLESTAHVLFTKTPDGKIHAHIKVQTPKNFKVEDAFPDLFKDIKGLAVSDLSITISTYEFEDPALGKILPGLNILGKADPSGLKLPADIAEKMKTFIKPGGLSFRVVLRQPISESIIETSVSREALLKNEVQINEFLQPVLDKLSGEVKTELEKATIDVQRIKLELLPFALVFEGSVNLFDAKGIVNLHLREKENKKLGIYLKAQLENWDIAETIPELKDKLNIKLRETSLVISDVEFKDPDTGVLVSPGVTLLAKTSFDALPGSIPDPLKSFIEKIKVKDLVFYGLIPKDAKKASFSIVLQGVEDIPLPQFFGPIVEKLPPDIKEQVKAAVLKTKKVEIRILPGQKELTFLAQGSVNFFNFEVTAEILFEQSPEKKLHTLVKIKMPEKFKIEEVLPGLFKQVEMAQGLELSNLNFALSTYELTDKGFGKILPGLNIIGRFDPTKLNLPELLASKLKEYLKGEGVTFRIVLRDPIKDSLFETNIPKDTLKKNKVAIADFLQPIIDQVTGNAKEDLEKASIDIENIKLELLPFALVFDGSATLFKTKGSVQLKLNKKNNILVIFLKSQL